MEFYTGWQWLLIDVANQFGLDKETFEKRIQWAEEKLNSLESLVNDADNKPLFLKAVMAVRKAQKGIPTGHMVGVDAICSGPQIMSVLTGCEVGATNTGLVDPDVRADAYTALTDNMNQILKSMGGKVNISRSTAKGAMMPCFYGSKAKPREVFGEDTPELYAFYEGAEATAPGAWDLIGVLLDSWKPYALDHSWKLPDGFDAKVKVFDQTTIRIEVDELEHTSFTYQFSEHKGVKRSKCNAANIVHSVDAFILREMHRRCNYDAEMLSNVDVLLEIEMIRRSLDKTPLPQAEGVISYYKKQYECSNMVSAVILPHLNAENIKQMDSGWLNKLADMVNGMLQYQSFPLITVHDEFKAHANNINWVRWQYKEILAEIAESDLLDDLLTQVYQRNVSYQKLSYNLANKIRNSNYALS